MVVTVVGVVENPSVGGATFMGVQKYNIIKYILHINKYSKILYYKNKDKVSLAVTPPFTQGLVAG